jgi:hypothetical protein
MPREEAFGGREAAGMELEGEGMRSAAGLARLDVLFGRPEGEGMGLERREMPREGSFGRSGRFFGGPGELSG